MKSFTPLVVLGVALAGTSAYGQLLSETFTYSDGALETVSSGAWVVHSGGTLNDPAGPALNVASGKAVVDQGDLTGSRADLNRAFDGAVTFDPATDNTSSIYYGLTVNFSALPNLAGSYFAHLKSSTTANEFYARLGASTEGATSGFRLAISSEGWSASTTTEFGSDLSLGTDYRVVIRYDLSTDRATLWVDPLSEGSTSVVSTDAPGYATGSLIGQFALRQGTSVSNSGFPGDLTVDDILVGTSFAQVITPVPEPEEYAALFAASLGAFALLRRRFARK